MPIHRLRIPRIYDTWHCRYCTTSSINTYGPTFASTTTRPSPRTANTKHPLGMVIMGIEPFLRVR